MSNLNEIISIHIGGAGCQLGNAFWELLCLEHGIQPDGQMPSDSTWGGGSDAFNTFFSETDSGKHVPRAIFADLETSVVDEIRTGMYRQLFHPEQLITGKEGASGNFARGYYTIGREHIDQVMEPIRKLVDACTNLGGFIVTMAIDGGTGAGFGSLLLERLSTEYSGKPRLVFALYPAPQVSRDITAPYNTVLTMDRLIKHSEATILIDNEAVYDICRKNLDIERPKYTNLNQIIAQVMASVTAGMRFGGSGSINLEDFVKNLKSEERDSKAHFLVPSLAPIISAEKAYHESLNGEEITYGAFEPQNSLVKCDPRHAKFITVNLIYRGDVASSDVDKAIENLQKGAIVSLSEFQTSMYNQPMAVPPGSDIAKARQSVLLLANTTAITQLFARLGKKFDSMFSQRAYVHHYLKKGIEEEGMEEEEFLEARESLAVLEKVYEDMAT